MANNNFLIIGATYHPPNIHASLWTKIL